MIERPLLVFIFKLAGYLKKTAVDIMQLSSWELTYWMAYDTIHPLPDPTWNAGLIAAAVINSQGPKEACHPEDFYQLGTRYREFLKEHRDAAAAARMQRQAAATAAIATINSQMAMIQAGVPLEEVLASGSTNPDPDSSPGTATRLAKTGAAG